MKEQHDGCCIVDPSGVPIRGPHLASPQVDPDLTMSRHRDGMSCVNPVAYVYDANGHRRWCLNCGTELGEQAWVEGGADVPDRVTGLAIAVLGVILLLVVALVALVGQPANQGGPGGIGGGVRVTPAPYGPPGPQGGPARGSLPAPSPLPAPVVR